MISRSAVAALLVLVAGCGGAAAMSTPPGDAQTDASTSDGNPADTAIVNEVASNGVPIPAGPLLPRPTCASLGVETIACSTVDCPPVACACNGMSVMVGLGCVGTCLTAVSCSAVCADGDNAVSDVDLCASHGVCAADRDCAAPTRCLLAPGDTRGECETPDPGSDCFKDADCATGLCVAHADGARLCENGRTGSPCNLDSQCVGSQHCVLGAVQWVGSCTDGRETSPCLRDADCQSLLTCLTSLKQCTTRGNGAPCITNVDCLDTFGCTAVGCSSGAVGAPCATAGDCSVPYCVQHKCSAGVSGDVCTSPSDCRGSCTFKKLFPNVCTDGQAGQPCNPPVAQCKVGLRCASSDGGDTGVCTAAGSVTGAACRADADCGTQMCSGSSGASGVCTDGRVGQACRDGQCGPGTQCVFAGQVGVCAVSVSDAGSGG